MRGYSGDIGPITRRRSELLVGRPEVRGLGDRIRSDGDPHAQHLLDVEFQHGLRRLVVSGAIGEDRAADARADFADLTTLRYPHVSLADRMWELRHNVTAYDAAFVAVRAWIGYTARLGRVSQKPVALEPQDNAVTKPGAERRPEHPVSCRDPAPILSGRCDRRSRPISHPARLPKSPADDGWARSCAAWPEHRTDGGE